MLAVVLFLHPIPAQASCGSAGYTFPTCTTEAEASDFTSTWNCDAGISPAYNSDGSGRINGYYWGTNLLGCPEENKGGPNNSLCRMWCASVFFGNGSECPADNPCCGNNSSPCCKDVCCGDPCCGDPSCEKAGNGGQGSNAGDGDGPPPTQGDSCSLTEGTTENPIALLSGVEGFSRTDLTIGTLYPIAVERRYSGRSSYDSSLGYGWGLNYDKRLYTYPDGSITFRMDCGKKKKYEWIPALEAYGQTVPQDSTLRQDKTTSVDYVYIAETGQWAEYYHVTTSDTPLDKTVTIVKNQDGSFTLTDKYGGKEEYDTSGRLTAKRAANGNMLAFSYEAVTRDQITGILPSNVGQTYPLVVAYDYRLSRIEEKNAGGSVTGVWVSFQYESGTGWLSSISDSAGRTVYYSHDSIGNLASISGPGGSATYGYNDSADRHRLTNIDEGSGEIVNTYDAKGRVTHQTHGNSEIDLAYPTTYSNATVTTNVKDASGNPLGTNVRSVSFDSLGLTSQSIHADGTKTVYTRNGHGWLISEARYDANNALLSSTSYTYDHWYACSDLTEFHVDCISMGAEKGDRLTKTEAPGTSLERTTTYTYHPVFSKVLTETVKSVVDPGQNKVITNTYDETNGNLLTTTETGLLGNGSAYTYTTTYTYDANGRITSINGPRTDANDVITFTYDSAGRLLTMTQPLIGTTTYSNHDNLGNPQTITDPNGNSTTYTYDATGRVTSVKTPGDANATQYVYVAGGCSSCGGGAATRIDHITLPEGNTIWYTYDTSGNLITIKDSLNNSINYTYDSEGNKLTEVIRDAGGALQKSLSYQYDVMNRLVKTLNPDSTYTQYAYDALGNRASVRNPNANTTAYQYDALNRLISVIQPGSVTTAYGYNSNNNLTSVKDTNNNTTTYKFDDHRRVFQVISPDTGTTTYSYDAAGNMISKTDAKGVTISYVYDAANRLTSITSPAVSGLAAFSIAYTYDSCVNGKGRLCSKADASGTTVYEWTAKGQLKKETKTIDSVQYVTQYSYDMNGNLKTLTDPSGEVTVYNFTNDKAVSVLNGAANLATNINYKPFGGISSLTYGNGLAGSIGYDNQYRVTGMTAGSALNLSYPTYDANGNIMTINNALDPTKNKAFTYDSLDRLSTATSSGIWGSLAWTYDGVGNRQTENSTTYSYTPSTNKLNTVGGVSYGFDNNGNTTSQGARQYTYNQNQRLVQVVDGAMTANYTYNGDGQRVKKNVNGSVTIFHYDQNGQLIAESNGAGAITARYVYLNGRPLAKIEGASVYFYHNDALGTPQKMTDSTGTVVWAADYKPFGEVTITVSTITNNLRFPGQYFDAETGLYQNWNRDYNWARGGYIESDPLNLGSLSLFRKVSLKKALKIYTTNPQRQHLFLYAHNNPLHKVDPTGLSAASCLLHVIKEIAGEVAMEYVGKAELEPDCGECTLVSSSTYGSSKFCFYQCHDEHGEPASNQVAVPVKSCPPGQCPGSWQPGQQL